jgi:hypothetical protein
MKAYGGVDVKCTYSSPRQQLQVNAQLHALAALHSVLIG